MDLVLESIQKLPEQLRQAWEEVSSLTIPADFAQAQNVIIAGMGGSALGGRIVKALYADQLTQPLEIINGYHLPQYADENSLVIISSYSGNTEETLANLTEALEKKCKIFVAATGGKLQEMAESQNLTAYLFKPEANPSGQPRMALGYALGTVLALFAKVQFLSLTYQELEEAIAAMEALLTRNETQSLAEKLKDQAVILVASEHLVGSAHAFKNQLNETAKTLSFAFDIPELNHHLMEGLKHPEEAKKMVKFFFFESNLYSPSVQKRYPITQDVVEKNGFTFLNYTLTSNTKLKQVLELLIFGSLLQYHLGVLYGEDLLAIPWVDYFKQKLAG